MIAANRSLSARDLLFQVLNGPACFSRPVWDDHRDGHGILQPIEAIEAAREFKPKRE